MQKYIDHAQHQHTSAGTAEGALSTFLAGSALACDITVYTFAGFDYINPIDALGNPTPLQVTDKHTNMSKTIPEWSNYYWDPIKSVAQQTRPANYVTPFIMSDVTVVSGSTIVVPTVLS